MLQKHQQILILIVGLLYIYSICPLLCATLEQKSCHSASQKVLMGDTEPRSTCCQSPKTDATGDAETPSESGKPCCSKGLELVLPDDRYNTHEFRESIEQSLVSILPLSVTLPIAPWELLNNSPAPLVSTFFPSHSLSYRGPPFTQC